MEPHATTPHKVWPDGPPCAAACPGEWSSYHEGFSWGYEVGSAFPGDLDRHRLRMACANAGISGPDRIAREYMALRSPRWARLRIIRCVLTGHAVGWGPCPRCGRRALG